MRFSTVVMTYFVLGAVMWGGGVIAWDDSGVGQFLIENPERGDTNENVRDNIEQAGGPIQQAAGTLSGGGLLAVWNFLVQLVGFLFWPITVLVSVNAPPRAIVLVGGTVSMAFFATLIRIIRSSA